MTKLKSSSCKMAWIQLLREAVRPVMTPESHGDNYYYHLLMLYLPWRQAYWVNITQLRRHSWLRRTNFSSLTLNMAHLLMLYNSCRVSKIHMVTTSMLQWPQMLYRTGELEAEFDPLFDGDVDIEEGAVDVQDNGNHQEATVQENGDLQAALFDDTDNNETNDRCRVQQ